MYKVKTVGILSTFLLVVSACVAAPVPQQSNNSNPSYEDMMRPSREFAATQQYYQQQQSQYNRQATQYVFTSRGMDMYVPIGSNMYMRID